MARYPGVWRSERDAAHDVFRRGLMAVKGGEPSAAPTSDPATAAPAAPAPRVPEIPEVCCERCGELVETSAAARDVHFKECPPDPPADGTEDLADEIRTRVLARGADRQVLDADFDRQVQIANARELAVPGGASRSTTLPRRGLLERARAGWEAGRIEV